MKFNTFETCPACGCPGRKTVYCEESCVRALGKYVNSTTIGSKISPHLHLICTRCGFEWTDSVVDMEKIERTF